MENDERKVLVDILKADKVKMDQLKEENEKLKEKILNLEIEKYLAMYESEYKEMDKEMKQEYDKACKVLAKIMEV